MTASAAAHKHDWNASERRSCHREPLQWAVLVFFGDNWGKLIDLSEKGMSFQFEHAPSLREPIHFTFEAMGCMPIPHDGKVFSDSIQATGQVIWTQEFERTAGVQFLELSSRSREQIRYWMSAVPSGQVTPQHETSEWDNEWSNDAPQEEPEPFPPPEPLASPTKSTLEPLSETSESAEDNLDSENKLLWEPHGPFSGERHDDSESEAELPVESQHSVGPQGIDPPSRERQSFWRANLDTTPEELASLAFEAPGLLQREERQRHGQTLGLKQQRSRIGYVAVLVFLIVVGAIAGILRFASEFSGGAEVARDISHPVAAADSGRTESRMVAENTGPFLVEVLDANNRRSVLWFSSDAHPSTPEHIALTSSSPAIPAPSSKKAIGEQKPAAAEGREPIHDFSMASPRAAGYPGTNAAESSAALVAPAIPGGVPASAEMPLLEDLPSPEIPAPVERTPALGGDVQPARLIHATLPDYPQLARTNHVTGDVTLDALVDASGNVRDIKVISGPVLLREAAKTALRQWKYEPARLDGRPTAMHLTVIVKFKNNQDNR
ncbi:MAG TPA: TonB family protein [Candidatus Acidoferrum sp.]